MTFHYLLLLLIILKADEACYIFHSRNNNSLLIIHVCMTYLLIIFRVLVLPVVSYGEYFNVMYSNASASNLAGLTGITCVLSRSLNSFRE